MKKMLCALLVVSMMLAFAACGGSQETKKATIYIPEKIEVYMSDGTLYASVTYNYEEGWQEKDSFTVTMTGDTDKLGGSGTTVYSDKKTVQEVSNGASAESHFDENGRSIMTINYYADGGRREVTYTHDDKGRVITEVEKTYESATAEPVTNTQNYTYTDTETGSTCTYSVDYATYVVEYDKNNQLIKQVMLMNDQEMSRTEASYDANGNMVSQVSYYNGQKNMEMKYTYKAVEVSAQTAARLPQFKQGK